MMWMKENMSKVKRKEVMLLSPLGILLTCKSFLIDATQDFATPQSSYSILHETEFCT